MTMQEREIQFPDWCRGFQAQEAWTYNIEQVKEAIHHPEFQRIADLPVFNSKNPPESVIEAVDDVVDGVDVGQLGLFSVKDLLITYYGVDGVDRESSFSSQYDMGYKFNYVMVGKWRNAVLTWCNRHCQTDFIARQEKHVLRFAENLDIREKLLSQARDQDFYKSNPMNSAASTTSQASTMSRRLLTLGLAPSWVAEEMNDRLLSVQLYEAPKVVGKQITAFSQEHRSTMGRSSGDYNRDRWEHAAIFLEKIKREDVRNFRAEVLLWALHKIQDRWIVDVADDLGVRGTALTVLISSARLELEESDFQPDLHQLYREEVGDVYFEKEVSWNDLHKKAKGRVNRSFFPLYLEYREQLAKESGAVSEEHAFSRAEILMLKGFAGGNNQSLIANSLDGSWTNHEVSESLLALLRPDYSQWRSTREEIVASHQEMKKQLSEMSETSDPILEAYGLDADSERLELCFAVLGLLSDGFTFREVRRRLEGKDPNSIVRFVRAVLDGRDPIHLQGRPSELFE